jgi:2-aminoadipate transaminase
VPGQPDIISFAGGLPAAELIPVDALAQAHAELFATEGRAARQYRITEGWLPLREWISNRMRRRGVDRPASNVLITTGSQKGIDLVGKVLHRSGRQGTSAKPELPRRGSRHSAFMRLHLSRRPSDDRGRCVDELEQVVRRERPKLIYTIPDFQNPSGTTLSLDRRKRLVEIATRHRVPILEDDPYGELRYKGEALPRLAALDTVGIVIYLSTFSKTFSPGMRVGWAVASDELDCAARGLENA